MTTTASPAPATSGTLAARPHDLLVAGGAGIRLLAFSPELIPVEGGVPLLDGGLVVGPIGVSGMQSFLDAQVALAGGRALGG